MPFLTVKTMTGLGDAFAARPTIAALLRGNVNIALETPWPEVYADLTSNHRFYGFIKPSPNVRCAIRNINETKTEWKKAPVGKSIRLSYALHPGCKSIPEQIAESADVLWNSIGEGFPRVDWRDFFIEDFVEFKKGAFEARWKSSPLGVFRLPTVRTEYFNIARNPYQGLVEIAIDEIGGDWIHLNNLTDISQKPYEKLESIPDSMVARYSEACLGQLSLPSMLDLVSRARCVVTPCSWMLWAAAAYQVPTLAIWGGYCSPETIMGPVISAGMRDSVKFVTPGKECWCFNPKHNCDKTTDVDKVRQAAKELVV